MFWFSNSENRNPVFMIVGIVAVLVTPIVAMMVQAAVSRQREYLADATGAMTTRDAEGLASALEKLGSVSTATKRQNSSTAHLFFANPIKSSALLNLFSTHPPMEQRIERLRSLGSKF